MPGIGVPGKVIFSSRKQALAIGLTDFSMRHYPMRLPHKKLSEAARKWEIPLDKKSSLWPSTAGLMPDNVGVVCGIGPVAQDLYTPQESINRISLVQRTLLLAQFLLAESKK